MAPRKSKGFADLFGQELYGAVIEFARLQTVEIMNAAAEAGPVWSGAFRDSWTAKANVPAASGRASSSYPYELRDIPRPKYDEATYKKRKELFSIDNEAAHRLYALGARRGLFYPPDDQPEPIGEPVLRGARITSADGTSMRADVIPFEEMSPEDLSGPLGRAGGSATAEEGWYEQLVKDLPDIMKERKPELMRKALRTAKEKIRRASK